MATNQLKIYKKYIRTAFRYYSLSGLSFLWIDFFSMVLKDFNSACRVLFTGCQESPGEASEHLKGVGTSRGREGG